MSLQTFTRKHDYLVCIDSDGCVMDTMNIKHLECFGPTMIEEWELQQWEDAILARWNEINLYSMTRGVNRFNALYVALREINDRYTPIEGLQDLEDFVMRSTELSNETLEVLIRRTGSICLHKTLNWSRNVNSRISLLGMYQKLPFPGVQEALAISRQFADIVIISSANRQAVEDEWNYYNLLGSVDEVLTQDVGTKDYCITELLTRGYDKDKVIMVGDAPGDRNAALETGVLYFPVLVRREAQSWREFIDVAIPKMKDGTYTGEYQDKLHEDFLHNLKV